MNARYVLAPQAAADLAEIWQYAKEQASITMANRVESVILDKITLLAGSPGAGHQRKI
jgi:plasmid stabilization system protein ParE